MEGGRQHSWWRPVHDFVCWIPAHKNFAQAENLGISCVDWIGNSLADELAREALAALSPPTDLVEAVQKIDSRALQVQQILSSVAFKTSHLAS